MKLMIREAGPTLMMNLLLQANHVLGTGAVGSLFVLRIMPESLIRIRPVARILNRVDHHY